MADKKESFFQKILGLFMSSDSPEALKRRKLKDIAKIIGKTRYSKWYKPGSQEVLPQAAQFFYSIYKVVGPARPLLAGIASSKVLKNVTVENALSDKQKKLLVEFKKLENKFNKASLIRNEVGQMGRAISKYMLSGISNIASVNFNKITGRTERIEWSNEEKDKYAVYLVGQERKIAFEQLSGGEQVSVAIAIRGTMTEYFTNSKFMILDEPTNNLDTERKKLLAEYMGEILNNLEQSIIVTHDDTFREMAEKIIEL